MQIVFNNISCSRTLIDPGAFQDPVQLGGVSGMEGPPEYHDDKDGKVSFHFQNTLFKEMLVECNPSSELESKCFFLHSTSGPKRS